MMLRSRDALALHYACRKLLPLSAAPRVWRLWSRFSHWPDWNSSLSSVIADDNHIALGRPLRVVPKANGFPVPALIVSFCEGVHFTATLQSDLGNLSFGHTLALDVESDGLWLEHTICASPADEDSFIERAWLDLTRDLEAAVAALSRLSGNESDL